MITKFRLYEFLTDYSDKKGKSIGKGGYGEVFEYIGEPNLVIKITTDDSEYESAKRLIGEDTKYIATYYVAEPTDLVCKRCNGCKGSYCKRYLLVMDKIDTHLPELYNKILDDLNIYCYDYDEEFYHKTLFDDDEIEFVIEDFSDEYPEEKLIFVINQLKEIVKECKKYGIYTNDFHSQNIGQKDEHLIFFDIGAQKREE